MYLAQTLIVQCVQDQKRIRERELCLSAISHLTWHPLVVIPDRNLVAQRHFVIKYSLSHWIVENKHNMHIASILSYTTQQLCRLHDLAAQQTATKMLQLNHRANGRP